MRIVSHTCCANISFPLALYFMSLSYSIVTCCNTYCTSICRVNDKKLLYNDCSNFILTCKFLNNSEQVFDIIVATYNFK